MTVIPTAIGREDEPVFLALNNAFAAEISWLEMSQLRALLKQAYYARKVASGDAFLLALDQTATYDSPNYRWFRERFERFVYIDRIVVAEEKRRLGYARLLYTDLIARASAEGHATIACEVNIDPPNPKSDSFHERLGFTEMGRASIHNGARSVRYLSRSIGGLQAT